MAVPKCKQCKGAEGVVQYGRGLKYRGVGLPAGKRCHGCMRKIKNDIDDMLEPPRGLNP